MRPVKLNALLPAMVDRVNGAHGRLCSRERRLLDGVQGKISSCRYAGAVLYKANVCCNHNLDVDALDHW